MKVYAHDSQFFITETDTPSSLITPFGYRSYQSIIRLHRDVFIICNANTNQWVLSRIIVP
eukprot:gnl/Chilomastix_caulleri/3826.p1 GENE.gnl/Chilomastix_caulleri/3826~~gnl/Chilomastix_caulleri/3826.p1  ORF type:complete len:60 (+),score=4.34 gnl/Chilomastix_caulleri/3826:117-296(+)